MTATSLSALPLTARPAYGRRERLGAPALPACASRAVFDVAAAAELGRLRRMRSLLSLLTLYAVTLAVVMTAADGPDVGCILAAIAGHVLHSTVRLVALWCEAASLEQAAARAAGG